MKKNLKTPTKIVGIRAQGFLKRMASSDGRKTIARRRRKGRKRVSL